MTTKPSFRRGSRLFSGALAVSLAIAMVPLLGGCSGPDRVDYARAYPSKPQATSLDVQLRRDETTVFITNTSARDFPESTLWINAQYARPMPALGVGQSASFDLSSFRNEYSEPFKAGGFFATERPDTIVLAQIEMESEFLGLVVVNGEP